MVLINNEWHHVRGFEDVVDLVRDNFNYDLAQELSELIKESEKDEDYKVSDLLLEISNLEDDLNNKDYEIGELQSELEELENEVKSKDNEIYELNNTIERLNKEIDEVTKNKCQK